MPESIKQTATVGIKYQKPTPEKSSYAKAIEASGQFVTPLKSKTIQSAAPKGILKLKSDDKSAPKVAPINRLGTISPPLKPAATETQVKSSFRKNASGLKLIEFGFSKPLSKIRSITFIPAPL